MEGKGREKQAAASILLKKKRQIYYISYRTIQVEVTYSSPLISWSSESSLQQSLISQGSYPVTRECLSSVTEWLWHFFMRSVKTPSLLLPLIGPSDKVSSKSNFISTWQSFWDLKLAIIPLLLTYTFPLYTSLVSSANFLIT